MLAIFIQMGESSTGANHNQKLAYMGDGARGGGVRGNKGGEE